VLREKWPLAFTVKQQDVRPLAIGATREIAAAMGWSLPYTLGVLGVMVESSRKSTLRTWGWGWESNVTAKASATGPMVGLQSL
jgi:hypothetical protein